MNGNVLPERSGPRPRTTPTNPHTQLEQNPERQVVEELARRVFALPGVEERPSAISVPGARALWFREGVQAWRQKAPGSAPGASSIPSTRLIYGQKREPTSGLEPLTPAPATSVRSVIAERCRGLQIPPR
jgi:hypothetical protein